MKSWAGNSMHAGQKERKNRVFEILKAAICIGALVGLVIYYELSGDVKIFTGEVLGKQRRCLEGSPDLLVVEIWHECPNGPNLYSLFVDESDFNRLWNDDTVAFEAKKGRLTKRLWHRRLIDSDFGRETPLLG